MPNRTTYILEAAETMVNASEHSNISTAKTMLKGIRKQFKSDIITDAYELLSDKIKAKIHLIMSGEV